MTHTVLKSVQAVRDIEEAFVYIAEDDVDTAIRFLVAVEDSIEMIAKNPHIGSLRRFEHSKLRNVCTWRVKGYENYLICYAVSEGVVEIVRFINSRRDFGLIFDL